MPTHLIPTRSTSVAPMLACVILAVLTVFTIPINQSHELHGADEVKYLDVPARIVYGGGYHDPGHLRIVESCLARVVREK